MRFLELNQIAEWCSEHGIAVDDQWKPTHPFSTRVLHRIVHAEGHRSGREQASAEECVHELGEWSECLLFVLQWGIWSSTEDWPAYYAARGGHDERRSLRVAPGHLFEWTERNELNRSLTMVMEFGWDAEVFPVIQSRPPTRRLFVSHDEWAEVRDVPPQ
jgi:hypothetical protein